VGDIFVCCERGENERWAIMCAGRGERQRWGIVLCAERKERLRVGR